MGWESKGEYLTMDVSFNTNFWYICKPNWVGLLKFVEAMLLLTFNI